MGEEGDEAKKKERARLLELVERTLKEIEATREALLADDLGERMRRLRLVHGFLAWKSATAFVLSTELREPDCVLSAGVARSGVLVAATPIIWKPLGVGAVEWLPERAVGDEVVALLPRGRVLLDVETEAALMRAFGSGGEFEARDA